MTIRLDLIFAIAFIALFLFVLLPVFLNFFYEVLKKKKKWWEE